MVVGAEYVVRVNATLTGISCTTFESTTDITDNIVAKSAESARKKVHDWFVKVVDVHNINSEFVVDIPVTLEERDVKVKGEVVKVRDKIAFSKVERKESSETFSVWRVVE
jgi:hypothetical protein